MREGRIVAFAGGENVCREERSVEESAQLALAGKIVVGVPSALVKYVLIFRDKNSRKELKAPSGHANQKTP